MKTSLESRYDLALDMIQGGATFQETVNAEVLSVSEAEKLRLSYQRIRSNRTLLGLKTDEDIRNAVKGDLEL